MHDLALEECLSLSVLICYPWVRHSKSAMFNLWVISLSLGLLSSRFSSLITAGLTFLLANRCSTYLLLFVHLIASPSTSLLPYLILHLWTSTAVVSCHLQGFVIPLLWSAQEQLFGKWMSFPVPCSAAFWFRSGSIKVLVLPGYTGLQPFLWLASNFLMKSKNLHMKEEESWELSAGSLWRIASQSLFRRSWWQHRIFSVMVSLCWSLSWWGQGFVLSGYAALGATNKFPLESNNLGVIWEGPR